MGGDLDQSWDQMRALLTNGQWYDLPESDVRKLATFGGKCLSHHHDIRILTANQVVEVDQYLSELNINELFDSADYDQLRSLNVYRCEGFNDENVRWLRKLLEEHLITFYRAAAKDSLAALSQLG